MKSAKSTSKSIGAGLLVAITASLCCITPVLALLSGVGGIAATFSWMDPFRPYLVVTTIGILGFAWYQLLKSRSVEEIDCECEDDKPSFWQSRKFLGLVTVFAGLMLAFPSYATIFYPSNNLNGAGLMDQDTTKTLSIELAVKGMTCSSCESHIIHEVGKLQGIESVQASYAAGTTSVKYVSSKVKKTDIIEAINRTGYTVTEGSKTPMVSNNLSDNISFYKVPLVCNAAPTIGCGSRAKPILQDFEANDNVDEAWLNEGGTVIAAVWKDNTDYKVRRDVANTVFTKHQVNASELLMDDYATNYESLSNKVGWLRNTDVDKLSRQEAGIIAEQILGPIKAKTKLSLANEDKLRVKTTDVFYDFFLNYQSLEALGDPNVYKEKLGEIISFGDELLGKGNMPDIDELWKACSSASKSCSHEGCTGTSCKIPKKS